MLRGSRGEVAGIELGSSFVERITVNVGTVSGLARCHVASMAVGLGPSSTDRSETGRSRRSTSSRGEPVHMGKGGSGCEKEGCCNAERRAGECRRTAGTLRGASPSGIGDAGQGSSLGHGADPGRRFDDLFNFVCDPATCWWRSSGSRATTGRILLAWTA
mgnify:CR=1 FL=1